MTLRVRLMILGKQIGRDLIPALAEKERIFAAPEEVSRAINKKQFTPKALAIVEASERIVSEWEKGNGKNQVLGEVQKQFTKNPLTKKERKKAYDLIVEKSKTRSDFGNLKIQKFRNSEIQKLRNSKTQKLGGLELWNFGILKIHKFKDLEFGGFGNFEPRKFGKVFVLLSAGAPSSGGVTP